MVADARARAFVAAAAQQKDTLDRLRSLRADLARERWWPVPDRRAVLDEIGGLAASLEHLERVLADREAAEETAAVLVSAALEEALAAGHGPDSLLSAVLGLLFLPGRPPLPDSRLSLHDLPGVAEHLGADAVRRQVSLSVAG